MVIFRLTYASAEDMIHGNVRGSFQSEEEKSDPIKCYGTRVQMTMMFEMLQQQFSDESRFHLQL